MNISIGKDSITGHEFFIDSSRHINIEGMSGMGKSTLLVNLFIENVRQGNGGLFIDPHGDTADQIAKLIPKNRMRDFIWIDPDASLVPPFNPLHFNSPEELELGKESLFTTFNLQAMRPAALWGCDCIRHPNGSSVYASNSPGKRSPSQLLIVRTGHGASTMMRKAPDVLISMSICEVFRMPSTRSSIDRSLMCSRILSCAPPTAT